MHVCAQCQTVTHTLIKCFKSEGWIFQWEDISFQRPDVSSNAVCYCHLVVMLGARKGISKPLQIWICTCQGLQVGDTHSSVGWKTESETQILPFNCETLRWTAEATYLQGLFPVLCKCWKLLMFFFSHAQKGKDPLYAQINKGKK